MDKCWSAIWKGILGKMKDAIEWYIDMKGWRACYRKQKSMLVAVSTAAQCCAFFVHLTQQFNNCFYLISECELLSLIFTVPGLFAMPHRGMVSPTMLSLKVGSNSLWVNSFSPLIYLNYSILWRICTQPIPESWSLRLKTFIRITDVFLTYHIL